MKNILFIISFFICPFLSSGQIIVDNYPINFYYSKIELSNLPEPEIGKQGMIFYTVDTAYLNNYIRNKVSHAINETKDELFKYKFRKNKYRYTKYFFTTDNIEYRSDKTFQTLNDTAYITILATKNKKKWNWRKFHFILIEKSVDTIYAVKVYSTNMFDTLSFPSLKYLTFQNLAITATRNEIEVLKNDIDIKEWSEYDTHLPFNFFDAIIKEKNIEGSLDLEHLYLKPGKEFANILFYCPVLFR
jgi:hypothetical protein